MRNLKNILREPLLHFLLIGAGLFLLFEVSQEQIPDAPDRIVISQGQLEQLQAQFKRTWMREPRQQELDGLMKGYVREEVLYREALAMGLDQNDPQVRQRMRLKLEFLLENITAEELPSDAILNTFLQQHPDRYFIQPRVSFQQLYLNPDKRADFDADAKRILKQLQQGAEVETLGDATMLPYELTQASQNEVRRSFGEVFAADVVKLPVGDWSGPIYSQLGVHLVRVSEHQAGFVLPQQLTRSLYREVLGQRGTPVLELGRSCARIGAFQYPLSEEADEQGIAAIKNILESNCDASLFLTSHFMYGTGARIITLSSVKPLAIIYEEIGPMHVRLD